MRHDFPGIQMSTGVTPDLMAGLLHLQEHLRHSSCPRAEYEEGGSRVLLSKGLQEGWRQILARTIVIAQDERPLRSHSGTKASLLGSADQMRHAVNNKARGDKRR